MLLPNFSVQREFNGVKFVVKTPKPSIQPLVAEIVSLLQNTTNSVKQMITTQAMIGLMVREPALGIDYPKRDSDYQYTEQSILEYGEKVADALDEYEDVDLTFIVDLLTKGGSGAVE